MPAALKTDASNIHEQAGVIRPVFERLGPVKGVAKLVFFTLAGAAAYGVLLLVMGVGAAMNEGWLLTAVTVILWDVLFLLVDRLLGIRKR